MARSSLINLLSAVALITLSSNHNYYPKAKGLGWPDSKPEDSRDPHKPLLLVSSAVHVNIQLRDPFQIGLIEFFTSHWWWHC